VNIVEKYDKQTLYLMLLKCYHCLHPIAKYEVGHACETTYANCDLHILEQIPSPSEPLIERICRNPTLAKCGGEAQHSQSWRLGVVWDS